MMNLIMMNKRISIGRIADLCNSSKLEQPNCTASWVLRLEAADELLYQR
jgi:hypothetical protein